MRFLLFPIAVLYGIIVLIRNKLFDWKIFPSTSFNIPIISIGNISVGGTGKTPHTEYLIRLLKETFQLAILSRGYGRKTKGFYVANSFSLAEEVGDEPRQYKQKFEDVEVIVCENRKKGIKNILSKFLDIKVIIMDDGFQHRWVKPGLSILLTDYFHLFTNDYLMPVGRLREFRSASKRADIIVVSKTPKVFSPILKRSLLDNLKLLPQQKIYFSYIEYGDFVLLPGLICNQIPEKHNCILLFTGIANPGPLEEHLERMCIEIEKLKYPDHHKYSTKDMEKIREIFHNIASPNKIIVTTEKDAMRLDNPDLIKILQGLPVYYVPIQTEFHEEDKENFNNQILEYVR
ncbi:MAG: tetraacyldisaccharide 4'-kinase [Saprospiraceae bacterium]|nr:tetraacyldisaccharide 4'-kinase [Saprospiraceae bacterium]